MTKHWKPWIESYTDVFPYWKAPEEIVEFIVWLTCFTGVIYLMVGMP